MTELCRIVVEADPNECSPNRRRKLRSYLRAKKAHRLAAQVAWHQAGKPVAVGRICVDVIVRRGRTMDEDNARAGLKHIFDGLFKRAITPDDSREYVELGALRMETGAHWKARPEVEVIVMQASA